MAQLRDARTSELVAEGSPEELVSLVDELGRRAAVHRGDGDLDPAVDLLFDGVGLGFDADAVRAAIVERADAMRSVAHAPDLPEQARENAAANLEELDALAAGAREAARDVADVIESAAPGNDTLPPVDVTEVVERRRGRP